VRDREFARDAVVVRSERPASRDVPMAAADKAESVPYRVPLTGMRDRGWNGAGTSRPASRSCAARISQCGGVPRRMTSIAWNLQSPHTATAMSRGRSVTRRAPCARGRNAPSWGSAPDTIDHGAAVPGRGARRANRRVPAPRGRVSERNVQHARMASMCLQAARW